LVLVVLAALPYLNHFSVEAVVAEVERQFDGFPHRLYRDQ
jgi:hypothetical protein